MTTSLKENKLPRGEERRKLILKSLRQCTLKNGYAKTTLADIAKTAGMYPSHLLYYFNGKDAILEYYFDKIATQIVERLETIRSEPVPKQIQLLSELFFAGEGISKSEIGFMLECFGVAVNDKVLRSEKSRLDEQCKSYLVDLYSSAPDAPRSVLENPRDAAEVSYALLIGLRSTVYFDESLNLQDAHRLFHSTLLTIAGLKN